MSRRPLLYIGDKNLSSWSLRPWLVLAQAGVEFDEEIIRLNMPDTRAKIARVSPTGRIPVLVHSGVRVWESLAICEYVAETWPEARLWPVDPAKRALARSVSNEMHAGFAALRQECPMAVTESRPGRALTDAAKADIKRILAIWEQCLGSGDLLFGHFTVADAMYAPVVTRFTTYAIDVPAFARRYMDAIWALPTMQRWKRAALAA